MVHLLDGDTDFFDIVAGVLQRDILAPYMFIICLNYILRKPMDRKENSFILKKTRSRRDPSETKTDADYTDDLVLLAYTPAQTAIPLV